MIGQTNRRINWVAGAVALLLSLLFVPAMAQGRQGALDPSFGSGGRVITPLKQSIEVEPIIGPDGSIVLLDESKIFRFLPDGSLDANFGEAGQVVLPEKVDGLGFRPSQIRVDSNGRLVVFGSVTDPAQQFSEPIGLWSVAATWPVVLRLMPDGTSDESFGEGRGFVRSDFGMRSGMDPQIPLALITGGQLDHLDRPVFELSVAELGNPCTLGKPTYGYVPRAIIRLTTSGATDPTFGAGDGASPISGIGDFPSLELDAAGGPAVKFRTANCRRGTRVLRLEPAGAPQPAFGTAGSRLYPGLYMWLMESSGALILERSSQRTRMLVRTLPNGEIDRAFGTRGKAVVRMPFGTDRRWRPVGVDAQRRILLVGSFNLPKPKKRTGDKRPPPRKADRQLRSFLAVGRLTASGKPDLSFGKRGWVSTRFKRPQDIDAEAALDPQGRLVVVLGSGSADQLPGPRRIVLARYLLGG